MRRMILLLTGLMVTTILFASPAPGGKPALPDDGRSHNDLVNDFLGNVLDLDDVRARGMTVFTTRFNKHDGYGDGRFDEAELPSLAFGHRPTLQGNGTFLRINGLDAQSCNECHTIVSHRTQPPKLGIGGVGGLVQTALIKPSLMDVADTFDDRVSFVLGHDPDLPLSWDGRADYNGRLANPPFLFGGGGVELLAKEMTADLQELLDVAQTSPEGTVTSLDTHGVNFGSLTTLDGREVQLDVEGSIGFADNSGHTPEEVMVVRPFGRKGENFSMRDFDRGAMQFHFGIQPVEVVGAGVDEDGDGVADEVTEGEMTALHIFDVTNPRPVEKRRNRTARRGADAFVAVGCGQCHIPVIETRSRFLPLAFPEVPEDPFANVYAEIDLADVGFDLAAGGGVLVPLYADLKRHDMGPGLAEDFEIADIPNQDFTTARLWGIADTAPYIHDGRALSEAKQSAIIAFLRTLRTAKAPNAELIGRRR